MINWTVVAMALLSQVLPATGTGSGRINQCFPSETVSDTVPAIYTTTENLISDVRYSGHGYLTTLRLNGQTIGPVVREENFEYDLFKNACELQSQCASAAYELLRFGRVLGPENLVPSTAPHWRKISYDGGQGWINLALNTIRRFSDADFPQWRGWTIVDESSDHDSRADASAIREILDENHDNEIGILEASAQLSSAAIQKKMARIICKIPSEWDQTTIDARWGWLKIATKEHPEALSDDDFDDLKRHITKLCFWNEAGVPIASDHWHFNPMEFVRVFKKCGWLSESEMLQLVPEHVIRKSGSHGSSNPSYWESPNLTVARNFLSHHRIDLNKALRKFLINTPQRQAAFFGNAVQETGWFKDLRESSGNTPQLHQGWYGRGFLQLTTPNGSINGGNNNYYKYFKFIGRSPHVPPGSQEIAWRDEVGTSSHHASQSAAAYWIWPDKSGSVHNSNVYADVAAANQRKSVQTTQGLKVWYYNRSFAKCASSVNLPGSINNDPPNTMNGLIDRSCAFINALMVLSDYPVFRDEHGDERSIPENFKRRIV